MLCIELKLEDLRESLDDCLLNEERVFEKQLLTQAAFRSRRPIVTYIFMSIQVCGIIYINTVY